MMTLTDIASMIENGLEVLAAMGVLENTASRAVVVAEFLLCPFHHGCRQHGRPGIEVEYLHSVFSFCSSLSGSI